MATSRMTFGAVLSTVTNTAEAISDLVTTAGDGIGMINSFVKNASIDQKERQVAHRATFRSQLMNEASMEISRNNKEVLDFMAESPDNKELFQSAMTDISQAFAKFDNPGRTPSA